MTDTHHDESHSAAVFKAYMVVAVALSIFTASSFFFNWLARHGTIGHYTSFVLILGVAVVKAMLVAIIFMHLKWDWKLLYYLIIPSFILGAMMMMVLMPDILLGSMHDQQAEIEIAKIAKEKP